MSENKSGFVYLWYDKKHQRYYVGCHWGLEDDGYICSSKWMKNSYKRRPKDFRRRIIAKVHTNRTDLLDEEFRWLSMIKDHEIKTRYYNLTKHHNGHWTSDEVKRKAVGQKISETNKGMAAWNKGLKGCYVRSEEAKRKTSKWLLENSPMRGKSHTKETKVKISNSKKGVALTEDHKNKISTYRIGKKHSEQAKAKMSLAAKNRSKVHNEK